MGALNSQVWDKLTSEGKVDATKVIEVFRTPTYFDYHWVLQPDVDSTFGDGFGAALTAAILALDGGTPEESAILEQFGAAKFVATKAANYDAIEAIAKKIGVIR